MERQESIGINLVVESLQAEYIHFGTVMRITEAYLKMEEENKNKTILVSFIIQINMREMNIWYLIS